MATKNASPVAKPIASSPPPVIQGQIVDPQIVPLDSTHVRFVPPAGAKAVQVRARIPGIAGGRYREPNEVFAFPLAVKEDGAFEDLPEWVTPLEPEELEALEAAADARRTSAPIPGADPSVPMMSHMDPPARDLGDTLSRHVF